LGVSLLGFHTPFHSLPTKSSLPHQTTSGAFINVVLIQSKEKKEFLMRREKKP
jgi:hypothetical protein